MGKLGKSKCVRSHGDRKRVCGSFFKSRHLRASEGINSMRAMGESRHRAELSPPNPGCKKQGEAIDTLWTEGVRQGAYIGSVCVHNGKGRCVLRWGGTDMSRFGENSRR